MKRDSYKLSRNEIGSVHLIVSIPEGVKSHFLFMFSNLSTSCTPWEFKYVTVKRVFGRNQKFTQDMPGMAISYNVKESKDT